MRNWCASLCASGSGGGEVRFYCDNDKQFSLCEIVAIYPIFGQHLDGSISGAFRHSHLGQERYFRSYQLLYVISNGAFRLEHFGGAAPQPFVNYYCVASSSRMQSAAIITLSDQLTSVCV